MGKINCNKLSVTNRVYQSGIGDISISNKENPVFQDYDFSNLSKTDTGGIILPSNIVLKDLQSYYLKVKWEKLESANTPYTSLFGVTEWSGGAPNSGTRNFGNTLYFANTGGLYLYLGTTRQVLDFGIPAGAYVDYTEEFLVDNKAKTVAWTHNNITKRGSYTGELTNKPIGLYCITNHNITGEVNAKSVLIKHFEIVDLTNDKSICDYRLVKGTQVDNLTTNLDFYDFVTGHRIPNIAKNDNFD